MQSQNFEVKTDIEVEKGIEFKIEIGGGIRSDMGHEIGIQVGTWNPIGIQSQLKKKFEARPAPTKKKFEAGTESTRIE